MAFTSSLESRALFKSRYLEEDRSSLDKSLNKNAGVIVQLCVDPRLRRERNYFAWFLYATFCGAIRRPPSACFRSDVFKDETKNGND